MFFGMIWWIQEYRESNQSVQNKTAEIVKTDDFERCNSVGESADSVNYEIVCRNNILLQRAFANVDFAQCQALDDHLMLIHDCEDTVLTLLLQKENTLSVCERAPERSKTACHDTYWSGAARAQNNSRLCENASAERSRENCEQQVLISSVSETKTLDCSVFTAKLVQRECQSYQRGNCRELVDPHLQDSCLQRSSP